MEGCFDMVAAYGMVWVQLISSHALENEEAVQVN